MEMADTKTINSENQNGEEWYYQGTGKTEKT